GARLVRATIGFGARLVRATIGFGARLVRATIGFGARLVRATIGFGARLVRATIRQRLGDVAHLDVLHPRAVPDQPPDAVGLRRWLIRRRLLGEAIRQLIDVF